MKRALAVLCLLAPPAWAQAPVTHDQAIGLAQAACGADCQRKFNTPMHWEAKPEPDGWRVQFVFDHAVKGSCTYYREFLVSSTGQVAGDRICVSAT